MLSAVQNNYSRADRDSCWAKIYKEIVTLQSYEIT